MDTPLSTPGLARAVAAALACVALAWAHPSAFGQASTQATKDPAAAAAVPPSAAAAAAAKAAWPARFAAAHEAYEKGHDGTAFAAFAGLADEGHCEAARVARQMALFGRRLYAMDFVVAPPRLALWQRQPVCGLAAASR